MERHASYYLLTVFQSVAVFITDTTVGTNNRVACNSNARFTFEHDKKAALATIASR